ncbi:hypothetical protein AB1282_00555 [Gottfriedia sp. S16(2024)]|uniref:hypothetical protein n=1 Tax=Gottfriedia sp. S16(2024) TaxID=3162883 RepID=UPI003D1DAA2E
MTNETLNESTFANFRRELQTLNYVELNVLMSDIVLEIKKRSYNEGMVKAMTSGISAEAIAPVGTPIQSEQEIRDEIIEKAKRDVAELEKNAESELNNGIEDGNFTYRQRINVIKFVINKEKRTVVALVCAKINPKLIREKGIAKCDPSDCFNAHIGKAIALRRALGLEVPSEYLTAPQPTEARTGDVVRSLMSGKEGEVVAKKKDRPVIADENGTYYTLGHSAWNIVDDSREGNAEGGDANGEG